MNVRYFERKVSADGLNHRVWMVVVRRQDPPQPETTRLTKALPALPKKRHRKKSEVRWT